MMTLYCPSVNQTRRVMADVAIEDDLIVEPIRFEDGYVPTPMDPGLGCDLDLEALPRCTREHQCLQ